MGSEIMKKRTFKRAVLGDIIEIPLSRGFAYVQYVYRHTTPPIVMGDLVRVLPGVYQKRPTDFSKLNAMHERFITFFLIGIAVRRKMASIVAHQEVPDRFAKLPLFKAVGWHDPRTGEVQSWWLWDGKKSWKVDELTEEQKRLPLQEFIGFPVLVERIESGWAPEDEVGKPKAKKKKR